MSSTTAIAWMGGGVVGAITLGAVAAGVVADVPPGDWGIVAVLGALATALLRMHGKQLARAEAHAKRRDEALGQWVRVMERIANRIQDTNDRIAESNESHVALGAKIDSALNTSLAARAESDRRLEDRLKNIDARLRGHGASGAGC